MTSPFVPADPEYESRIRASVGRQGAMAYLGAELEAVAPGLQTLMCLVDRARVRG